jgi:hypothetical protein
MRAIRSLKYNYDVVMVGWHHQVPAMVASDIEMPAFVKHEDLGLIDDVLASLNFNAWKLDVCVGLANYL